MPGGDELLGVKAAYGIGAALMFQAAGTNVYDAFSAVMSSPWSTEKFTNDPEEERMARQYVKHALVISGSYAGISAVLAYAAGGPALAVWPIIGAAGVAVYMYWLYARALARSQNGGMTAEAPDQAGNDNGAPRSSRVGSYPWST
jgi:hypothetical protein